jgi:hypothetical protein
MARWIGNMPGRFLGNTFQGMHSGTEQHRLAERHVMPIFGCNMIVYETEYRLLFVANRKPPTTVPKGDRDEKAAGT